MHRIDHATAEADKHGAGKDGFTEGDPTSGAAPTTVTADWFDDVQESIARTIEDSDGGNTPLVKGSDEQLKDAIRTMIATPAFESSEIAVTVSAASTYTAAHGLSRIPKQVRVVLRCKTAEHGYAVDDEAQIVSNDSAGTDLITVVADDTNIDVLQRANLRICDKASPGTLRTPTNANWRVVIYVW